MKGTPAHSPRPFYSSILAPMAGLKSSAPFLLGCAVLLSCLVGRVVHAETSNLSPAAFSFDELVRMAGESAKKAYEAPKPIPDYLDKLNDQQWEKIHFQTGEEPWPANYNFNIRFYHLGYLYKKPVNMNIVDSKGVHPFPFSPREFDYGGSDFATKVPEGLGFAGFVLSYPLSGPKGHEAVLEFLGASYFRAAGKNQVFGLAARGVSIDTASPSGEQFPYFKEFWLERPEANATSMKIYALLDGESVTGAYQFVVRPGVQTVTEVDSVLFLRKKVQKFGVAPFGSMFLHGSNTKRCFDIVALQAHNSDGLSIQMEGGKWIWRPLQNPQRLAVYSFLVDSLSGFGLMQRDRRFCRYESLSPSYEKRPSAWLTPDGEWGKGQVQLIEIPTDTDNNDNIVAFWVPDTLPEPQNPVRHDYKIAWQGDQMTVPPLGYAVNTLTGKGNVAPDAEEFDIDFKGKKLVSLLDTGISTHISVESGGKLLEQHIVRNPHVDGLRLEFQIKPTGKPVQLRAYLVKDDEPLTETWDYVANP